jgi:hypothetical protein
MADTQQQIAELSEKLAGLQASLGALSGEVAELNTIMAPFMARYQLLIWPYYDALANVQREIADLRVEKGDKSAIGRGEASSPLDRFFEEAGVQEQYERSWQGKKATRPTGPLNITYAPEEIKQLYAEVIGYLHPELAEDKAERDHRRQLMVKVDEAYVRRDQPSLDAVAEMYRNRRNLPGQAAEDVIQGLRDRVVLMETAIAKVEGQKFELRHGLIAKIKAYAEQLWADEKRDLLNELGQEIQRSLNEAQAELDALRAKQ